MDYKIIKLEPKDYEKCGGIWNMESHPERTKKWYDEIISGNRIVFIYTENNEFIGEGALVLDNGDRDYTIPGQRVYLSRMIVKPERRNQGIGSIILDFLIDRAIQMGFKEMALGVDKVNTVARHLYEKKGFNTVIFDGTDEYGEFVKLLKQLEYSYVSVIQHYDSIIDEINDPLQYKVVDPAHDPEPLRAYMDKWDGEAFTEAMQLVPDKSVLEIGVGTGRLALRVCGKCESFTGIDISPKTVERAKENLRAFQNVALFCGDFMIFPFTETFDVIYSSLTFMHIKNKRGAIQKAADLLCLNGRFVLSISKNQQTEIDYGTRKITVYPDTSEKIAPLITEAGLIIENQFETEFAVIFVAVKEVAI